MGWLGWTYDQVLDTPFAEIERAYDGRMDMLRACFGGGEEAPAPVLPAESVFGAFRAAAAPSKK